jgi:hypothetical protein
VLKKLPGGLMLKRVSLLAASGILVSIFGSKNNVVFAIPFRER